MLANIDPGLWGERDSAVQDAGHFFVLPAEIEAEDHVAIRRLRPVLRVCPLASMIFATTARPSRIRRTLCLHSLIWMPPR